MKTIFSPLHRGHCPTFELNRGKLVTPFERPERVDRIHEAIVAAKVGPVLEPQPVSLEAIKRVHAPDYVDFLAVAYRDWTADGRDGDALPSVWPVRGLRDDVVPKSIVGRLSYYSFDGMSPIVA